VQPGISPWSTARHLRAHHTSITLPSQAPYSLRLPLPPHETLYDLSKLSATGMAEPGRHDDAEVPSSPPPSFTSLPDVAHAVIASFLPDGYRGTCDRLRVARVSRSLLEFYGASITHLNLRGVKDGTESRLTALIRRQNELKAISAFVQKSFPGIF